MSYLSTLYVSAGFVKSRGSSSQSSASGIHMHSLLFDALTSGEPVYILQTPPIMLSSFTKKGEIESASSTLVILVTNDHIIRVLTCFLHSLLTGISQVILNKKREKEHQSSPEIPV